MIHGDTSTRDVGRKEIPDIGINAENDRNEVGGTKTLFPNCRPRTPIQDQELKDKGPGLTRLGGKCERNHRRRGQEYPQSEVCAEPSNRRRPDILQPHTSERAISENPKRGSLGSSTKIRRIANRSNELASDKIHRPEEGTYEGLIKILGTTQVVAPIERLKTGWKARVIAKASPTTNSTSSLLRGRSHLDQLNKHFATRMPSIHLQGKPRDRIRQERRVMIIPLIYVIVTQPTPVERTCQRSRRTPNCSYIN